MDVRSVLSAIGVPTLVLHRTDFAIAPIEHGRYLADHIAGAKFIEVLGSDACFFTEGADEVPGEVEEFLTGTRPVAEAERMLATVLILTSWGPPSGPRCSATATGGCSWTRSMRSFGRSWGGSADSVGAIGTVLPRADPGICPRTRSSGGRTALLVPPSR
jgi:hypothetical protein